MTVRAVHEWWAWVMIGANAVAGVWALGAHWLTALRVRPLWWFTAAAETAVFVQVILGTYMVSAEKVAVPQFHMFYGFVAIISVAIIYSYRHQLEQRKYLLYGLGGLFIMGLGLRAIEVGNRPL